MQGMSHHLSRVLTVLSITCAMSLPGMAFAAGADISAQTGHWVTGPIQMDGAPAKYCSMKNTYGNGETVVFARDAAGVNSIAIDFGKKTLQAGHPYPVTLDLPPLLTRDMTAVAATRQVLLVNMGDDKGFYEALSRMEALYLTALKKEHAYALTGTAAALRDLKECAHALAPANTSVRAPVVKAPLAEDARRDKRDKIAKLQTENKVLKKEAAKMEAASAFRKQAEKEKDDAAKAASRLAMQQKSLENENARLRVAMSAMSAAEQERDEISRNNARLEAARAARKTTTPLPAAQESVKEIPVVKPPASLQDRIGAILAAAGASSETMSAPRQEAEEMVWDWQMGDLFGALTLKPLPQGKSFQEMIAGYFGQMSLLCSGDLSHTAGKQGAVGGMMMQESDMSCTDDADNAAVLLFAGDAKNFAVVTLEGVSGQMDAAIAKRNAAASAVLSESVN
jgi:hypothetical protein